jgi:bacterial/archaeal transporter family protein
MRLTLSWQALALASAMCAALSAVFGKVGVSQIPPDLATLFRTFVLLVVFVPIVLLSGQFQAAGSIPRQALLFLSLSALAGAGSWFFYFRAVKIGDVSRVAPIDKLSIVFVALFGVIFLGERLSLANWAGVVLMTGGLLLIALR